MTSPPIKNPPIKLWRFIWAGAWYAKFSRYYILLFPFLAIWAAYAFERLNKKLQLLTLIFIAINGLLFFRIYLAPNTRFEASGWIYKNIPSGSVITGEHWDDNLPLPMTEFANTKYILKQATVYNPENSEKFSNLATLLAESNYFVISSRRVSESIMLNKEKYPRTSYFYELLNNGGLGYKKIKTFTNYPFIISDDAADESFQSYDHPPVYIYKNVAKITADEILKIITYGK